MNIEFRVASAVVVRSRVRERRARAEAVRVARGFEGVEERNRCGRIRNGFDFEISFLKFISCV